MSVQDEQNMFDKAKWLILWILLEVKQHSWFLKNIFLNSELIAIALWENLWEVWLLTVSKDYVSQKKLTKALVLVKTWWLGVDKEWCPRCTACYVGATTPHVITRFKEQFGRKEKSVLITWWHVPLALMCQRRTWTLSAALYMGRCIYWHLRHCGL